MSQAPERGGSPVSAAAGVAGVEGGEGRVVVEVLETDEARTLLDVGREAGSLSTEEIALALDELDLEAGQLDELFHALEEAHIDVVDTVAEVERPLDVETREVSTDSLQLFLKDIGRVPLLTAAQEVELA